jgi:hypothetical protein
VGISREKIYVIPPAVAVGQNSPHIQPPHLREAPRRKPLLCVTDCSGPRVSHEPLQIVLDALDILRQRNDPKIRVTTSG